MNPGSLTGSNFVPVNHGSHSYSGTGFFSGFPVPVPVSNRNRNRNRKTGFFPVSKIIKIRFYQVFDIPNNKFDFSLLFLLIFMHPIVFKLSFLSKKSEFLKDFSNI